MSRLLEVGDAWRMDFVADIGDGLGAGGGDDTGSGGAKSGFERERGYRSCSGAGFCGPSKGRS
jgi:hypothetical protein